MRRIGLFGGTFDPPHFGHLAFAECARDRLALDEVRFIPAGLPPHKARRSVSGAAHRVSMARLAVRGNPAFRVSTVELGRGGPSFTVETLRRVADEVPGARLFLLLGSDSLDEFATWREPQAILRMATLVVAGRPGAGGDHGAGRGHGRRPASRLARRRAGARARPGRVVWLDNVAIALSSSLVRARIRAGRSVRYLVPDPVAAYVARHRLYRERR